MLEINLTPLEELESPHWYVPDLLGLVATLLLGYGGLQYYLGIQEQEIFDVQTEIAALETDLRQIQGEASQFDDLDQKVTRLESKKNSLSRITQSKLVRYQPIVLIESLQNLRPEGLWFNSIAFGDPDLSPDARADRLRRAATEAVGRLPEEGPSSSSDTAGDNNDNVLNDTPSQANDNPNNGLPGELAQVTGSQAGKTRIRIRGSAFSKILIGEFMTAIKATQNQEFNPLDVRSQLFFSQVTINSAELATTSRESNSAREVSDFELILEFKEKTTSSNIDRRLSKFIDDFKKYGRAVLR